MKKKTEEELIDLAIAGNQLAWEEMYRRYYGRVKRIVSWGKWGFRYAEVDEIVQEVFLELMKALPNFRRRPAFPLFLHAFQKTNVYRFSAEKALRKGPGRNTGLFSRTAGRKTENGRFLSNPSGEIHRRQFFSKRKQCS